MPQLYQRGHTRVARYDEPNEFLGALSALSPPRIFSYSCLPYRTDERKPTFNAAFLVGNDSGSKHTVHRISSEDMRLRRKIRSTELIDGMILVMPDGDVYEMFSTRLGSQDVLTPFRAWYQATEELQLFEPRLLRSEGSLIAEATREDLHLRARVPYIDDFVRQMLERLDPNIRDWIMDAD